MGGPANDFERVLQLLGPRLDEVRSLFDDLGSRWRGDAVRVGEGTQRRVQDLARELGLVTREEGDELELRVGEGSRRRVQDLARELGLVTRDEWDELELRVAQLEHRLRLVEDPPQAERP
jgi:polyhydroxyalkanoate synthesis regulator phasin